MEALIMMIVLGLISSFFGKKDQQKKKSKNMPPFSNPKVPEKRTPARTEPNRPRSLEDFANEIFGQLNEKKPIPIEAPKPVAIEPEIVKQTREEVKRPASTRPALGERSLVKKLQQEQVFTVVPTNQKQLMQAVVMAEILGKPKAKQ